MAVADLVQSVREKLSPEQIIRIPKDVDDRIKRGRKAMLRKAAQRRLCLRFWRGETYWYINGKGQLLQQNLITNADGSGKPPHRIRNRFGIIEPLVQGKVSAATQKVPSYQVLPTSPEPKIVFAAELSRKGALYGYDKWRIRRATVETVEYALVCDGGFAMPYFDASVGPYIDVTTVDGTTGEELGSEKVGQGEIKVLVLNGNQVMWEPGCGFDDSKWWAVERAMPVDEVKDFPGYVGGPLVPDASTSDVPTDREDQDNMVLVTEYFERPSPKYPDGRKLTVANKRVILPLGETYPLSDPDGNVIDEPIIHPLSWTVDPDDDRDRGLVEQLIDIERAFQDCLNKISEWKNRTLNPQMLAVEGQLLKRPNDVPGDIRYFKPIGNFTPQWEQPPRTPQELFQFAEYLQQLASQIAADAPQVEVGSNVAAGTVNAAIEQAQDRWQTFLGDLAEWHSRVMRHCLTLMAKHYTEERLLVVQGPSGPDITQAFRGEDLMSQVNIRVTPESLQAVSQQAVESRATSWAQLGWISPTTAMRAINAGTTEGILDSYEKDVGRMQMIIERIKQGPEVLFSMPEQWNPDQPATDPNTGQPILDPMGQPVMGTYVPGWMPRPFDDVDVQLEVLESWMKGSEFDRAEPGMQEAAYKIHQALADIQNQREVEAEIKKQQVAAGLGMANAAAPQTKQMPDQPKPPEGS